MKGIKDGKTLVIGTSPMGTSVALRLDPQSENPFIYLARMPGSRHPFTQMFLNSLVRLVLVGGAFCYLLTAYFIRPITNLNRAAEEFGAGDLKRRVPDSTSLRTDEFGELGRAFNQMATRIESLVVRYKTFLAQASHEMGSPLTRLNIALALAKRTAGSQLHSELGRIGREADSLNSLVQELLLLARLESGNELTQEAVVYDVTSVVDEVCANASFEANEHNKSVIMLKREGFQLVGYPNLLQRALDNVLRNGLRFCRARGCVQVSFYKKAGFRNPTKTEMELLKRRSLMNKRTLGIVFLLRRGRLLLGRSTEGGGGRQSPIAKLMNDLQQAAPRAKLSDDQNNKLQSDIAALKNAQQAKRQGQSVDQDKVQAALNDQHQIVDSGAFQDADQKQLDQDFAAI